MLWAAQAEARVSASEMWGKRKTDERKKRDKLTEGKRGKTVKSETLCRPGCFHVGEK